METARLQVTPEQTGDFLIDSMSVTERTPARFFDMEDMGHQKWADMKISICSLPAFHLDYYMNVPIPRTGKR
jgi:hypothetical protein